MRDGLRIEHSFLTVQGLFGSGYGLWFEASNHNM